MFQIYTTFILLLTFYKESILVSKFSKLKKIKFHLIVTNVVQVKHFDFKYLAKHTLCNSSTCYVMSSHHICQNHLQFISWNHQPNQPNQCIAPDITITCSSSSCFQMQMSAFTKKLNLTCWLSVNVDAIFRSTNVVP